MPYIKREQRDRIDPLVNALDSKIDSIGDLNYAISRLCHNWITRTGGLSYTSGNAIMGVLESAKAEFYRRVLAPYEDAKIEENGDLRTPEWKKK